MSLNQIYLKPLENIIAQRRVNIFQPNIIGGIYYYLFCKQNSFSNVLISINHNHHKKCAGDSISHIWRKDGYKFYNFRSEKQYFSSSRIFITLK